MSTQIARDSFAGTSKGKAPRCSPAISSTSGTSASGHWPFCPKAPELLVMLRYASRYSVTLPAGIAEGPLSGCTAARTPVAPPLPPATTTWKLANSLRATVRAMDGWVRAAVAGRTFTLALSAYTVGAAAAGSPRRAAPKARRSVVLWMKWLGMAPRTPSPRGAIPEL
jgi:hypothetical protein